MEVVDVTDVTWDSKPVVIKPEDIESDTENPSDSIPRFLLETQRSPSPISIRHSQENSGDDGEFQYKCNTIKEEVQIISCQGNVEEENNPIEVINEVQKRVDSTLIQTVEPVEPLPGEETLNKSQPDGETNQNKYFFDRQVHKDEFIYKTNGYGCAHCLYLSSSWLEVKHHIRFDHRDPSITKQTGGLKQCPHCPQKVIRLARHIYNCHTESAAIKWLFCDHCDHKTKTKRLLRNHIRSKHIKFSKLKCEECGKGFNIQRQLTDHIKSIHQSGTMVRFTCDSCNYTTRWKNTMNRHMLLHKRPKEGKRRFLLMKESNPREVINEVQKTVDSTLIQTVELVKPLSELAVESNNVKVHNGKPNDGKCVREGTAEETLNKSQPDGETNQNKYFFDRQVHQDEFIYKTNGYGCAHCLYLSSSWLEMQHHIRFDHRDPSITKRTGGLKQCPHCPQKVIRLAPHIYHCHTESAAIKWLFCDHCDHKTKAKRLLRNHIRSKHIESSELKCKECGKGFKTRGQLTDHIKSVHKPGTMVLFTSLNRHKRPKGDKRRFLLMEESNPREVINEVQKTVDSTLIQTVELVKPLSERAVESNNEKVHNDKPNDGKCVREETADKTLNKSQPDGETNQNKYFFDLKVHQDEFIYKTDGYGCAHCLYLSSSWLDMRHHIRFDHRDPSIKKRTEQLKQCPYCPKKAIGLAYHIYNCHRESTAIKWLFCGHCDYKTKTKQVLVSHIQIKHMELSELKCEECGKGFKIQKQLTAHMSIHKSRTMDQFTCDSCNYTTWLRSRMNRHMLRHKQPEEGKRFACKKCEFHTQSRSRLGLHNKKEHLDWEQCHLCSYRCTSKNFLKLHLIHHQDKKKEEDLIYRCNKCPYKTYRVYNLQSHELSHKKPEEIDMFRCYHCDFKAKRKDNLKTHIFKHDLYKNILSCYICTYKTRSNYELKKHIDGHSEDQRREKVELTKLASGKIQVNGSEDKNEENMAEQRKKVKNTKASIDAKEKPRKKLKRSCKKLNT